MANGFFESLQDIGTSVGGFARQKLSAQAAQQQQKQKLADAIALAQAQVDIKAQNVSPLDQLILRAKAAESAKTLGNEQLFNQIVGTQQGQQPVIAPVGGGQVLQPQFQTQPIAQEQQVQQSLATPQDLIPKKIEVGDFGKISSTQFISLQALIDENVAKEAVKVTGKQLETLVKTSGNLSRVENAFSGLVAQAKRAVQEQGGFGAKAAIGARGQRFAQRLGFGEERPLEEQFGGLAGFDAQRQEVILSLSPILTGQNRILRSALIMLKKTVPDLPITGTTEAEFGENIRQSMKNAFKISLGVSRGLLTPQQMADLSQNASDEQITKFLTDLVNKTKFDQNDEKFFNQLFSRVIQTPATKPVGLFQPGEIGFGGFQQQLQGQAQQPSQQLQDIEREIAEINAQLGEQ